MNKRTWFYLFGLIVLPTWGCRSANDPDKLAEVDGTVITREQVDHSAGKQLQSLRQQLYQLEQQKLEEYISATLLTREAKDRGVSVSMLLDQEVNNKVPPISEKEIQSFYEKNKDRIRVELEKVHDQIGNYLREQ